MNAETRITGNWAQTDTQPRIAIIGAGMSGIAAVVMYSGGSKPSEQDASKTSSSAKAASGSVALAARPRQSAPRTREVAPRNTPSARMSALADSMNAAKDSDTNNTPAKPGADQDTSEKTPTAAPANEAKNHAPDSTATPTPRPATGAPTAPE